MMKQMMKINNKMYKILLLVKLESKEQKVMKMLMMPIVLLMKELKIDLLMKTMVKNKQHNKKIIMLIMKNKYPNKQLYLHKIINKYKPVKIALIMKDKQETE